MFFLTAGASPVTLKENANIGLSYAKQHVKQKHWSIWPFGCKIRNLTNDGQKGIWLGIFGKSQINFPQPLDPESSLP